MNQERKLIAFASALLLGGAGLSGCSTGSAIGGVAGGTAGAAVGGTEGALIGGTAGAVAGEIIDDRKQ